MTNKQGSRSQKVHSRNGWSQTCTIVVMLFLLTLPVALLAAMIEDAPEVSGQEADYRLTSGAGLDVLLTANEGGWQLQPADPDHRLAWRDPNNADGNPVRHIRALLPGGAGAAPLLWLDPSVSDILFDSRTRRLVLDNALTARDCTAAPCPATTSGTIEISLSADGRRLLLDGLSYPLSGMTEHAEETPLVVISRSQAGRLN